MLAYTMWLLGLGSAWSANDEAARMQFVSLVASVETFALFGLFCAPSNAWYRFKVQTVPVRGWVGGCVISCQCWKISMPCLGISIAFIHCRPFQLLQETINDNDKKSNLTVGIYCQWNILWVIVFYVAFHAKFKWHLEHKCSYSKLYCTVCIRCLIDILLCVFYVPIHAIFKFH